MTENTAILRQKQEKSEQDYDALVTQLNRCQGQLGAKQAQNQKLSPPEYQKWLVEKKDEHAGIVVKLQAAKKHRSEARRMFNSWQPQVKEVWLDAPDDPGWWWHYHEKGDELTMVRVAEDDENDLVIEHEGTCHSVEMLSEMAIFVGKWKYQEEPETP